MELPGFPRRTNRPEDSKNLDNATKVVDIESLEMKLITSINEMDELKKSIQKSSETIISEIRNVRGEIAGQLKGVDSDIGTLSDIVKHVPKDTLVELSSIKRSHPMMYDEIKQTIGEKIRSSVLDVIDKNILKIVQAAAKLNSCDLLEKTEASHVCSKNTLFSHIKRLEDAGMLNKGRSGHQVIYSLSEEALKKLGNEPKEETMAPAEGSKNLEETSKAAEGSNPPEGASKRPEEGQQQQAKDGQEAPTEGSKNLEESSKPPEGSGPPEEPSKKTEEEQQRQPKTAHSEPGKGGRNPEESPIPSEGGKLPEGKAKKPKEARQQAQKAAKHVSQESKPK